MKKGRPYRIPVVFRAWTMEQQVAYRLEKMLGEAFYAGANWAVAHPELMPPQDAPVKCMTLADWIVEPDPLEWASNVAVRSILNLCGGPYFGLSQETIDRYAPPSAEETK